MAWRKRPKPIDHSAIQSLHEQMPQLGLDAMSSHGPGLPLLADSNLSLARVDLERDWQAIGEKAWTVLQQRRMRDILPCDTMCEFDRYLDVLHRSSPAFREEIFVGLERPSGRPILVPRFIFERHAYILGASGSGKTSHGIAQLLIQLAEEHTDRRGRHHPPPPILIIDLKQSGDRYLRALAERLARERNQPLRFFSNDYDYQSLIFDPLHCLRNVKYPLKLLETILKAFSMIYPEGYGSDFFTNEQRIQLMEILYSAEPKSFDALIAYIRETTRRNSASNKDARGLYSALAALEHAMHIQTDGTPVSDEDRIDFDRFFDQQEILYVHLDSRSLSLLSRDVGKLLLFCLLETASQREKDGRKVQAFVFIDEFHRLAARNIVEMLEDARSAGLGFIIAHQSSSSLKTRDADLYGSLFENCSFKQCLTLEDERVIKLFQLIAGRVTEYRHGESFSETRSTGTTKGRQQSRTEGFGHGGEEAVLFGLLGTQYAAPRYMESGSMAETEGQTESVSRGETHSRQEEKVSRLTPEMIVEVNDHQLFSLMHVKGVGSNSKTPTGGVPIVIEGLYPFLPDTAQTMLGEPWPRKANIDPEVYYHAIRKRNAAAVSGKAKPARPAASKTPLPDVVANGGRHDEGEERALRQRIVELADRLADQMITEPMRAAHLARRYQISVRKLSALARTIGIDIQPDKDATLTPAQVQALQKMLNSAQDQQE